VRVVAQGEMAPKKTTTPDLTLNMES